MTKTTVASVKAELDAALSRIDELETTVLQLRAKVFGSTAPSETPVVREGGVTCGKCSSGSKVVKHESLAAVRECYGVKVAS